MSKEEGTRKGVTRREFVKTVGTAGLLQRGFYVAPGLPAAAARDHILIGHPTPATGPLPPSGKRPDGSTNV